MHMTTRSRPLPHTPTAEPAETTTGHRADHKESQTTRLRIGVALGGGSARGYAHIGALACLERNGLVPTVIAGTSFGAVVGALYATGATPRELARDAARLRRRDVLPHFADFGLHRASLFAGEKLELYLDRMLEGRHFADLERHLVVVTTDVDTGERVLLDSGPLARALRASTALPGIFAPVEIDGRRLIDGGIGSPIPLDTLETLDVDLALGIGAGVEAGDSGTIRMVRRILRSSLGQRLHLAIGRPGRTHPLARLGRALAYTATGYLTPQDHGERLHVQTRPPISWLNFHQAEAAIYAGEEALERFLPRIRSAMLDLAPA